MVSATVNCGDENCRDAESLERELTKKKRKRRKSRVRNSEYRILLDSWDVGEEERETGKEVRAGIIRSSRSGGRLRSVDLA